MQRLSGLTVESPQASSVREASLSGQAFFIASGPALPAGTALRLTLAGLPHKSPLPLYLALGAGCRGGGRRRVAGDDAEHRAATTAAGVWRRDAHADWRRWRRSTPTIGPDGSESPAYDERRARLLADLERVYGALDQGRRSARRRPGSGRVSFDFDQVHASGISRHFGRRRALSQVTFSCRAGEVLGLLGPNGAGKSTLLAWCRRCCDRAAGRLLYGAPRGVAGRCLLRRRLGWLGHDLQLYPELTARENLPSSPACRA